MSFLITPIFTGLCGVGGREEGGKRPYTALPSLAPSLCQAPTPPATGLSPNPPPHPRPRPLNCQLA